MTQLLHIYDTGQSTRFTDLSNNLNLLLKCVKKNKTCTEVTVMHNVMRTKTKKDKPNAMEIHKKYRLHFKRSG